MDAQWRRAVQAEVQAAFKLILMSLEKEEWYKTLLAKGTTPEVRTPDRLLLVSCSHVRSLCSVSPVSKCVCMCSFLGSHSSVVLQYIYVCTYVLYTRASLRYIVGRLFWFQVLARQHTQE